MKPRHLRIDFAGMPLAWSPNAEFAAITNSGSPLTSAVEPYLNIVMSRVRDALPAEQSELKRQIDIFIRQEAYHYRLHDSFNRELYAAGYPGLKELAEQLKADLKEMLERRSLVWNLAFAHLRHSHVALPFPHWLSHVLVSPHMHQVHHSVEERHHDRNYATVFALWDWIFGSLYIPHPRERFRFGVEEAAPEPAAVPATPR